MSGRNEDPSSLDGAEKKYRDSQYLYTWVNAMQRWLAIKGISLDSKEALEVVGFKLEGSTLTTYTHFERKLKRQASYRTEGFSESIYRKGMLNLPTLWTITLTIYW